MPVSFPSLSCRLVSQPALTRLSLSQHCLARLCFSQHCLARLSLARPQERRVSCSFDVRACRQTLLQLSFLLPSAWGCHSLTGSAVWAVPVRRLASRISVSSAGRVQAVQDLPKLHSWGTLHFWSDFEGGRRGQGSRKARDNVCLQFWMGTAAIDDKTCKRSST